MCPDHLGGASALGGRLQPPLSDGDPEGGPCSFPIGCRRRTGPAAGSPPTGTSRSGAPMTRRLQPRRWACLQESLRSCRPCCRAAAAPARSSRPTRPPGWCRYAARPARWRRCVHRRTGRLGSGPATRCSPGAWRPSSRSSWLRGDTSRPPSGPPARTGASRTGGSPRPTTDGWRCWRRRYPRPHTRCSARIPTRCGRPPSCSPRSATRSRTAAPVSAPGPPPLVPPPLVRPTGCSGGSPHWSVTTRSSCCPRTASSRRSPAGRPRCCAATGTPRPGCACSCTRRTSRTPTTALRRGRWPITCRPPTIPAC